MKIKSLRIQNYKSWYDSEELPLSDGLNIIVGQNNAGKSALLEALSLSKGFIPHKSIITKTTTETVLEHYSKFKVVFEVSAAEFQRLVSNLQGIFFIPLPVDNMHPTMAINVVKNKLKEDQIITAQFFDTSLARTELDKSWYSPSGEFFEGKVDSREKILTLSSSNILKSEQIGINTLSNGLVELLRKNIFFFKAERFNLGESNILNNSILESNSNNLAQVLNFLQTSNPIRFKRFVQLVSKVLPQIKAITVPPIGNNAQILVWNIDPDSERSDLAIPLNQSGTGIGQVLAITYVLINSDYPQCILIDEPQSFLHPSAIRSLMEIFLQYPQHQYLITTHSPNILSIPSANVIHIKYDGTTSKAEFIGELETKEMRLILEDMGSKLSEVFGADKILWVEGPTEEECFKLILRKLKKEPIWGLEILGVRSTGELEGRQAEIIYDIYNKLCNGKGIIPPAIGFIFDREERTQNQMEDLKRKSNNKVRFLERRMFENYLLNPEVISILINRTKEFNKNVSSKEIKDWIITHSNTKSIIKRSEEPFSDKWLKNVNGARLLNNLFTKVSEGRVTYHKIKHGYQLTEIILEMSPEIFNPIAAIVDEVQMA